MDSRRATGRGTGSRPAPVTAAASRSVSSSSPEVLLGEYHGLLGPVYVAYGTAISYGIDLDAALDEVRCVKLSYLIQSIYAEARPGRSAGP
jgi:predicted HAD superfamily Cof-like phosphohydrolase